MGKFLILGLIGYSGSGKGEFCKIAKNKFGIERFSTGDLIRNETKKRKLPLNHENIQYVSGLIDNETGNQLMKYAVSYIREFQILNIPVVIDCLRTKDDFKLLSNFFGNKLVTIAICANDEDRYRRIISRGRDDVVGEFDKFLEFAEIESKIGTKFLFDISDYTLKNNCSIQDFELTVIRLINALIN